MKHNIAGDNKSYIFFFKSKDFLDDFLVRQCGKSRKTAESYRDALTIFRRYITDVKRIQLLKFTFDDFTRDIVLDYMDYLKKKYTVKTCNHRLAALKTYVNYCADEEVTLIPKQLMISRIPFMQEPRRVQETLSEEMIKALISAPEKGKFKNRDKLLMMLLYDSAVRIDELLSLKLKDIHLEANNSYLMIHGKGNKERMAVITDYTATYVSSYIHEFHSSPHPEENLFYTTIKGRKGKMSAENAGRIIKKYAELVRNHGSFHDLPEKVYPHMLRRTRATNLYRDGVPLELVSRILGHSSTETTKIYAIPSPEMFREAMENNLGLQEEEPLWNDDDQILKELGLR